MSDYTTTFIKAKTVNESLAAEPFEGKHELSPLKGISAEVGLFVNILENHEVENDAEVHRHQADIWIGIEGETKFIVGGRLVDAWAKDLGDGLVDDRELKSKTIEGGEEYIVGPGDILLIPAGVPHQHSATHARLWIMKANQDEIDLLDIPGWDNK